MTDILLDDAPSLAATPIDLVDPADLAAYRASLPKEQGDYLSAAGFKGRLGTMALVPDGKGGIGRVAFGLGAKGETARNGFLPGKLVTMLPEGTYRFATPPEDADLAVVSFALGAYRFERYRKSQPNGVKLVVPAGVDGAEARRMADALANARDLINTPANDLGPAELAVAARKVAEKHGASYAEIVGDELLKQSFPMIHAVGRAAVPSRAPRLIDIRWGGEGDPRVTLVGKGVCFDTGGLDIKPSSAMLNMKKDMGGAAHVLALAEMIMGAGLRLRLRVLIPAVENAIAGDSFRPGDVLSSRAGVSVEIGNTDAEGRLILGDALALASEEKPALIVDYATLTGAARVALGPELAVFFARDDALASDLMRHASSRVDPMWRLPLWQPYVEMIESKVADINNAGSVPMAGSITAALFLDRFVEKGLSWLHHDIFAWSPSAKPGHPQGADVQGARALYALLKERYPAERERRQG